MLQRQPQQVEEPEGRPEWPQEVAKVPGRQGGHATEWRGRPGSPPGEPGGRAGAQRRQVTEQPLRGPWQQCNAPAQQNLQEESPNR